MNKTRPLAPAFGHAQKVHGLGLSQGFVAILGLALWALGSGSALAQITVGNSVFPRAGDSLRHAIDRNPGPAITVTPPGLGQRWDFSSLVASQTWVETLQPAALGAGSEFFPGATLVYTQNGPRDIVSLLPGSNGAQAYLKVTDNRVGLLGFHGGSDALGLGVGAVVRSADDCNDVPGCQPDLRTVFMTRYPANGVELTWAPKQFFDIRQNSSVFNEEYPFVAFGGLSPNFTALRVNAIVSTLTVIEGSGTMTLPGGTFDVLREKTLTTVTLSLDARFPPTAGSPGNWVEVTGIATTAIPGVRWGSWQQSSYRYFDATSKESLAVTRSPIALDGFGDSQLIESVQFKNLSPIPEPQTAWLFLLGLTGTALTLRAHARCDKGQPHVPVNLG